MCGTTCASRSLIVCILLLLVCVSSRASPADSQPEVVKFGGDSNTPLGGLLYKPEGPGPFPALIYNHGSAPGRQNDQAFERLGPLFAEHGWVFFAPYRRGQGLSAESGRYILDEVSAAGRSGGRSVLLFVIPPVITSLIAIGIVLRKRRVWLRASAATLVAVLGFVVFQMASLNARASAMVHLLETEQLQDHLSAYAWLKEQPFTDASRIATAGNSFGGVITLLAAERVPYCAAIDASGGAESWRRAPKLQTRMTEAARAAKAPLFLFQAENDYTTAPTLKLAAELKDARKPFESRIYPPFGNSAAEGHAFAWRGSDIWSADVFRFLSEHCR